MSAGAVAAPVRPPADPPAPSRSGSWTLTLLFLAFPLWWVLGLSEFIFLIAAVPMAWRLIRLPKVVVPRGFGWWLAFLAVVLLSATMLTTKAPYSVTDPLSSSILTYGYRLCWYLAVTVALLYVLNTPSSRLPARRVSRLLGYLFVVTACGGLLGILLPNLEFTSPLEMVLPHSLSSNKFLHALIHPATADIQAVLGFDQARPRAPFSYANSWGANFSFLLPFFLQTWLGRDAGWRRLAVWPVLAIAAVPVIYSLNRALWGALLVGAAYGVFQLLRTYGTRVLKWLVPAAVVGLTCALLSPLPGMVAERFAHQHSNERRSELAVRTVEAVVQGSPLIGFGNTRDVEGSFGSIAGGATADCPACSVPPFGTQGHFWLLVFAQGLLGALTFLAFFVVQLLRHVRERGTTAMVGLAVLLFFFIEMWFYDILGAPLFVLMLTVGLMARASADQEVAG